MQPTATLDYIHKKYKFRYHQPMPIVLPFDRFGGMLGLFNELGLKVGAEIGVSKGRYSKWMLHCIKGLKLYLIDPWTAYSEYVEAHDEKGQVMLDNFFEETKVRLVGKNVEFIRKTSMEAVKDFEDESLDFVFIDGNHSFEYVIDDIAAWSKKVKKGGIVSGHDYWNSFNKDGWVEDPTPEERMKLCQVKGAVDAWTEANRIPVWFITSGEKRTSWLWVK